MSEKLLTGSAACGQQDAVKREQRSVPDKTVEAVLKRHTDSLMSVPGVVGTALGECSGKPCIKVYVVKKTPDLVKQIPSSIEGFLVEIQETREIRALEPS